jgi:integrase
MRGHIVRRGQRFYVVVDIGLKPDGKRKQKWHSGFTTRKEAERFLNKTLTELDTGAYVEPSSMRLRDYIENEWLPASVVRLRTTTQCSYSQTLRRLLIPELGDVRLRDLTPVTLTKLYGQLLSAGRVRGTASPGLSPRTVRYLDMIVTKALNDAVSWGYLAVNPAHGAMPPSASAARGPEMRTWTSDEVRHFLNATKGDPWHIGYLLAATCGLRRGEICGLRWSDVELDGSTPHLRVRQQLVEVGGQLSFGEPKTRAGRRTIALDPFTVAALRRHRRERQEAHLLWGPLWADSGLVLTTDQGDRRRPDSMTQAFNRRVRALNMPIIRLHDLRHTHATLGLGAGVHPKVMTERLGHSSTAFTMDTYSHVMPGMQANAAALIAQQLFGELTEGPDPARTHTEAPAHIVEGGTPG